MEKTKIKVPKRNKTLKDVAKHFDVIALTVHKWKKKGCPHETIPMPGEKSTRQAIRFNIGEVKKWHTNYIKNIKPGRKSGNEKN